MSERNEKFEGNQILVELAGTFDVSAAWRVHDELIKVPTTVRVMLDFTRVGERHDLALATLVGALAAMRHRKVECRGLAKQRLLWNFGAQKVNSTSAVASDLGPILATA